MAEGMMTANEVAGLGVGEVLVATGDLSNYPHYHVAEGARFVVVANTLGGPHGVASLRLAPADAGMLEAGDLGEWHGCVEVYEPPFFSLDDDEGVAPGDRAAPGSAWNKPMLDVARAPGRLSTAERIAAVFAFRLADALDDADMAEVVRRNAARPDGAPCASHAFADADAVMLSAFKDIGEPTPSDALRDPSLGDGPARLWADAWSVASASWLVDPTPKGDEPEADASPRP